MSRRDDVRRICGEGRFFTVAAIAALVGVTIAAAFIFGG